MLCRERVATRVPIINIERENRKAAVVQTLLPDYVVHYPMGLQTEQNELKGLTNLSAIAQYH